MNDVVQEREKGNKIFVRYNANGEFHLSPKNPDRIKDRDAVFNRKFLESKHLTRKSKLTRRV